MKMLKQNTKLKKDKIWSFGITPAITCPMAGACKKYCYAQKGCYKMFAKTVQPKLERDHLATLQPDFVPNMVNEIKRKRAIRAVRIHSEGDFYNQEYLNKWIRIAKLCKDISFYCYTKSLHLDWSEWETLPNTKHIQSVGGKLDHQIDKSKPHAVIFDSKDDLEAAGYINVSDSDVKAIDKNNIKIGIIKH